MYLHHRPQNCAFVQWYMLHSVVRSSVRSLKTDRPKHFLTRPDRPKTESRGPNGPKGHEKDRNSPFEPKFAYFSSTFVHFIPKLAHFSSKFAHFSFKFAHSSPKFAHRKMDIGIYCYFIKTERPKDRPKLK